MRKRDEGKQRKGKRERDIERMKNERERERKGREMFYFVYLCIYFALPEENK